MAFTLPAFGITELPILAGLAFTADGFRVVYGLLAGFMWLMTLLFGRQYFARERAHYGRYLSFVLVTLAAVEGVFFSADFMTAFVFFEILSFTSFVWVIHEESAEAIRAAYTYLFIAVIGGLLVLMGILLLKSTAGTLRFDELPAALRESVAMATDHTGYFRVWTAAVLILLGFGAKAGMFPLHVWLPKAHPVAPSPASALLSGMLTKVGIYGILMTALHVMMKERDFGFLILVLGTITMVLGAVLALFSVNVKRTLACSSMSQIGFILTGIAARILGTAAGNAELAEMALSGVFLHMTNHSLIKLLLFMAAGVLLMNGAGLELNRVRGYGRRKPFLAAVFAMGALAISGVPGFGGYLSKTLLHESLIEAMGLGYGTAILKTAEILFVISGGFTFAYMLKLYLCLFVEKNEDAAQQAVYDAKGPYLTGLSRIVLLLSALALLPMGVPAAALHLAEVMRGSAQSFHFAAFSWESLKGGLTSLAIGAALYLLNRRLLMEARGNVRHYVDKWPAGLDLEERVYRPLLMRILPGFFGRIADFIDRSPFLTGPARFILFLGTFVGRSLADSTDGVVYLLRRSIFKERRPRIGNAEEAPSRLDVLRKGTETTAQELSVNFSFAMLMTCIGIVLILGVLAVML